MRSFVASAYFSFLVYLFVVLPLFATLQQQQNPEAQHQKQQQQVDVGAYFKHKTVIIPHDSKKHRGGEDSASSSDTVLVVADGVGGWARHGVNPGLYSKLLTQTVVDLALAATTTEDDDSSSSNNNITSSLIDVVHKANWIAAEKHLGSATCTTLQITSPTTLSTLNVGDSGYSIHRLSSTDGDSSSRSSSSRSDGNESPEEDGNDKPLKNIWNFMSRRKSRRGNYQSAVREDLVKTERGVELVYASEPGQKSFNFPHQLGGRHGDEVADVGVSMTHDDMQDGDIVIVFSDGVSDNIDPIDFHGCILTYLNDDDDRQMSEGNKENDENGNAEGGGSQEAFASYTLVADCIARTAYELGKDDKFDSPFARGAREAGWGNDYTGGKHDDISVIVAQYFVGSPANARQQENDNDPHYSESIFLYTDDVPPLSALPTKPALRAIKTEL